MRSSSASSKRHAVRHISVQRIVRRGLIGQNVRNDAALGEFRNDVGTVADQSNGDIFFLADRILQDAQRLIERRDHEVAVAGLQALLDALRIDVDAEESRASHGCGERLSSAHSAHSAADDQLAGEIAAEMFLACGGEGFECAFHNSLRADVDPGTGGHLAVHHESGALQFVELLPVRPMADEIGIRDEHARRVIVRLEYANRLAGLHQQRLVVVKLLQRFDDGAIGFPTARGASGSAIDDEIFGALGDFFVEVVHQHAHGSFLLPAFASDLIAAGRANGGGGLDFGFDGHREMLVVPIEGRNSVATSASQILKPLRARRCTKEPMSSALECGTLPGAVGGAVAGGDVCGGMHVGDAGFLLVYRHHDVFLNDFPVGLPGHGIGGNLP